MQEQDIIEADFEEVIEEQPNVNVGTPGHVDHGATTDKTADAGKLSKTEIMKALKDAISGGMIAPKNGKRMREEMGIFNSDFTKKKITNTKRKSKRKAQKNARKKQRK